MKTEVFGKGKPLVLIHGWGMSSRVWMDTAERLSGKNKIYLIDLPGMGSSKMIYPYSIEKILEEINAIAEEQISIMGWSLGGQLAIEYQNKYRKKVKQLILVSTTPCFVNNNNWNYGVERKVFDNFSSSVLYDWHSAMRKFFNLQLIGAKDKKNILAKLENYFLNKKSPSIEALGKGLRFLIDNDYRDKLKRIKIPVLILSGNKDKLIPLKASEFLNENILNSRLKIIDGATHIPFMSHQEIFIQHVSEFMKINDK